MFTEHLNLDKVMRKWYLTFAVVPTTLSHVTQFDQSSNLASNFVA